MSRTSFEYCFLFSRFFDHEEYIKQEFTVVLDRRKGGWSNVNATLAKLKVCNFLLLFGQENYEPCLGLSWGSCGEKSTGNPNIIYNLFIVFLEDLDTEE